MEYESLFFFEVEEVWCLYGGLWELELFGGLGRSDSIVNVWDWFVFFVGILGYKGDFVFGGSYFGWGVVGRGCWRVLYGFGNEFVCFG